MVTGNEKVAARRQAHEDWIQERWLAARLKATCARAGCDNLLPPPKATGRPAVWCSAKCRRAAASEAARARKVAAAEEAATAGESTPPRTCPRPSCGNELPADASPRQIWCSTSCRRAAGNERRAAEAGAIAVRVERIEVERIVERVIERPVETPVEHDLDECVRRALASPGACRRILQALTRQARETGLDDAKWSPVADAATALAAQLNKPVHRW